MNVQEPTPKNALLRGSRTFQRCCLALRKRWNAIRQDWNSVPLMIRRGDALR